jgi:3-oxoacyl-[acyl-carrier protein] reductase
MYDTTEGPSTNPAGDRFVAVITGGAGGIGKVLCACLARSGSIVISADFEPSDAAPDVANVQQFKCDVRSQDDVDALFEHASQFGTINAVVTCHGVVAPTPLESVSPEQLLRMNDVNLGGVIRICAAATHHLREGSAIVNISSVVASRGGTPDTVVYAATKAGIESVTRHYAVGLAPRGIRVNAVAPGFVEASMAGPGKEIRSQMGGDFSSITSQIPSGRMVKQQEVADVVQYLLSPRASAVTGVLIPVDGGLLARG